MNTYLNVKKIIPMRFRYRLMDLRGRGIYSGYPNKYKCIFIHIPKCAGTSIASGLFKQSSRHVPYFEYQIANPRKFKEFFKFTFTRNPWDRLLSAYIFLKKGGLNQMDHAWSEANLKSILTFEQFVREWVTEKNVWTWIHFMPQHYFICNKDGKVMMDFVGRFENLQKDFAYVAHKLDKKAGLPIINKTRESDYTRFYDEETRAIVSKVYKRDIELFRYEFNTGR